MAVADKKAKTRIGYTVFWLDGKAFAFRAHYFESSDFISAYRRVSRFRLRHDGRFEISGFFLSEAPLAALKRFFHTGIYSVKSDFVEIESHMYAPEHLLR